MSLTTRSNPLSALFDPVASSRDRIDAQYQAPASRSWWIALGAGLAAIAVTLFFSIAGGELAKQALFAYTTAYAFGLSLTLGALFFVLVQHIASAHWSVVLRRIPEALMTNFPILAIMFLPIAFGMHDLYHWTHAELYDINDPAYDAIIAGKEGYLNTTFFLIRWLIYFVAWYILSSKAYRLSVQQDLYPRAETKVELKRTAAWGIPVFALTTAFAGFDLIMSMDPHWFSTMYGVYFFAGGFVSAIAAIIAILLLFRRKGALVGIVTKEHLQDMGKFLFAFTVFWAYIAFSQYMLIWYGNIPEETLFFRHRMEHGWKAWSAILLFAHFLVPFVLLLPRATKRNMTALSIMAGWILAAHWIDMFWNVNPILNVHHAPGAGVIVLNVVAVLGVFGILAGATLWRLSRHSLTPFNDPYFETSKRFENV